MMQAPRPPSIRQKMMSAAPRALPLFGALAALVALAVLRFSTPQ